MPATAGHTAADAFVQRLLTGCPAVPAAGQSWLSRIRSEALERANALTVPTTRDEAWRFTDLSPMAKLGFLPAPSGECDPAAIAGRVLPEAGARLVFVDGHYAPGLSCPVTTGALSVTALSAASPPSAALTEPLLARLAEFRDNVFVALNTAYLADAAVVHAGRDCAAATVHLLFVATSRAAPQAAYPRTLVSVEQGSHLTLVEDFVSLGEAAHFTDAVAEISLAESASLEHVRVQRENVAAFHIGHAKVKLARAARYRAAPLSLGARISRLDLAVEHAAEGASAEIDGLLLVDGRRLADLHSFIDHARADCRTSQLQKCIAAGAGRAVFNGRILVRQHAQRTDARQQSRNLLLSERAHVDTKPQLEIFADDVKCAHGATVGQLDAESLFYLRSRGLGEDAARNLLTYAFAAEVAERVPVESLRRDLSRAIEQFTRT